MAEAPDLIPRDTRGLRNRNPGNLRFSPDVPWEGLTGHDGDGFCVFDADVHGIRAVIIDLHTHFVRGQHTIRALVSTYAPPTENDTDAYIRFVADGAGIGADEAIEVFTRDLADTLFRALCTFENGVMPYPAETIGAGLDAAFAQFEG